MSLYIGITENALTSPKINILEQNLDRKCIVTLLSDLYQNIWKFKQSPGFSRFPDFS